MTPAEISKGVADMRKVLPEISAAIEAEAFALGQEVCTPDRYLDLDDPSTVERLALYLHQSRHSNDDPEFDMDVARERIAGIVKRLREERP
jgi:hypothetical protein